MKNKDKILDLISEKNRTASEIAELLDIPRNYVSSILNALVKEEKVLKSASRPVIFSSAEEVFLDSPDSDEENPLTSVIGYNGSLMNQLHLCAQAVKYPKGSLPIMLLGNSGVGKSYLAEKIVNYAKYEGVIQENAPFVTLNCADYADNPELLSSILFGYTKGAFTGANADTVGLLEKGNGGFLFLDEVHRLSAEGQEKLFHYLDKQIVVPLGSKKEISVNTKLICATTADERSFLDTFTRRIPIIVKIPDFISRSLDERRVIIHRFFLNEAQIFNQEIEVNGLIFESLLNYQGYGNLGKIKNIIKILCTSAGTAETTIKIKTIHAMLIPDFKLMFSQERSFPSVVIKKEAIVPKNSFSWEILDTFTETVSRQLTCEKGDFKAECARLIAELFEKFHYEYFNEYFETLVAPSIKSGLDYAASKYGIHYDSITQTFLSKLTDYLSRRNIISETQRETENKLKARVKNRFRKEYTVAESIFNILFSFNLLEKVNEEIFVIVTTVLIVSRSNLDKELCNALIIAHGTSTATSISSVVNSLYGDFIFEGFDMPLSTTKDEVVSKIKQYLAQVDCKKDTFIFVDMGSLVNIDKELENVIYGNMVIVNNVSTQIALEAANGFKRKKPIKNIARDIVEKNEIMFTFHKGKVKQKVILVCCLTGAGTSAKIASILEGCTLGIDVKFQEIDYLKSKELENIEDDFPDWEILGVITTIQIKNPSYPSVLLSNLISTDGLARFSSFLEGANVPGRQVEEVVNRVVEEFSELNLLSKLTFLNPASVIPDVQEVIRSFEMLNLYTVTYEKKFLLYIHIVVMIERLIKDSSYLETDAIVEYRRENEGELRQIKNGMKILETEYNVLVNDYELMLIRMLLTDAGES
ncbi:sigma 54-interacting transcriptional regulator [Lactovum odontotermitis]